MKLVTAVVLCSFILSRVVFAGSYNVKCLNTEGKFKDCKVTLDGENVQIEFDSRSDKDGDVIIPAKNIRALTAGEYARRRVAESIASAVLLAPVALFALFSKKKRDHIGIEYTEGTKNKAVLLELKKKYGFAMKTELESLTGKEIREEAASKK